MKFDDKTMKSVDRSKLKDRNLFVEGTGRIEDPESINLTESVNPDLVIDGNLAYTVINFPKRIKFSKEYGNTVYDVVADFSSEGKRVFCRPTYGYMRADDSKQWIIDEGVAKIVRRIFDMCLQGLSTGEIAKQLQSEKNVNYLELIDIRVENGSVGQGWGGCREGPVRPSQLRAGAPPA